MKEEEHECVGHVNLALEPDHIPGLQPGNTPHLPRRLLTAAWTSPRRRPGTGPRSPR